MCVKLLEKHECGSVVHKITNLTAIYFLPDILRILLMIH